MLNAPEYLTDEELMSRSVMQPEKSYIRKAFDFFTGGSPSGRASFMLPGMGMARQPMEDFYMTFGGKALRKVLGTTPELPKRAVGDSLADLAAKGQIDRPWPGIYKGAMSEGRTQPLSYRAPKTYELPVGGTTELEDLLTQVGGKYKGPVSGGAPKNETLKKKLLRGDFD